MTSPGAQVSGPGAYSQRTDTGGQPIRSLPDPKYGEAGEFAALQKAAPLADSAPLPPGTPPSEMVPTGDQPAPDQRPSVPGLFDPGDPNIPVTDGAPLGPGANEVSGGSFNPPSMSLSQQVGQYAAGDNSGAIAWLANSLAQMGQ